MSFLNTGGKGLLLLVGHHAQEQRIIIRQEIRQEKGVLVSDKGTLLHQPLFPNRAQELKDSLRSTTGFCHLPSLL